MLSGEKWIMDIYYGINAEIKVLLKKIVIRTNYNGWIGNETPVFSTVNYERTILGNDNLIK